MTDVLSDADVCSPFTIQRNPGQFSGGGWQAYTPQIIRAFGAVRNATGRELEMVPEADRVHESMSFRSTTPMYMTDEAMGITADILTWNGEQYRVVLSKNYSEQGYYFAIARRTAGA
jgi:hypothetical protein